jgi:DNA-nicking Smr family endonuclease
MKDFAELARLRDALKAQALADQKAREEAAALAARRAREAQAFRQAIGEVKPLRPTGRAQTNPPAPPAVPLQRQRDEQAALAESLSDEIDIERLLDTDEALSYRRPGIGADVIARLRRGQWAVATQIDLHGMRVPEAREALARFLDQALRREQRCVRVIHGKGLGSVQREPVLKGKVLKWLVQWEEVLAFCQARPNDGGAGALLVLLRSPSG